MNIVHTIQAMHANYTAILAVILLSLWLHSPSWAQESSKPSTHPIVAELIEQSEPPFGVVFDIETLEHRALTEVLPFVRQQIKRLRQRFPQLDIAIVTHGTEQFALQNSASKDNQALHQTFNRLVANDAINVHVCGAVAGLKELTREDFVDFVDVSASGMAQINDYKALDYTVVPIKQLNSQQRKALFEQPQQFLP